MVVFVLCVLSVPKAHAGYPWLQDVIDSYLLNLSYQEYAETDSDKHEIGWAQLFSPAGFRGPANQVLSETAGCKDQNTLGLYALSPVMAGILRSDNVFNTFEAPSNLCVFDPVPVFGLWLKNPRGSTFYSQMLTNTDQFKHFRAFYDPHYKGEDSQYILRAEDLLAWKSGKGYNDMVFTLSRVGANPIPEPSTMFLLVTALFASGLQFVRKRYNALRRISDIAISSVALVLTAPLMLIAAIMIKLDSPGPIFYKQVRVGLNRRTRDRRNGKRSVDGRDVRVDNTLGAPFTIYKLRSMRIDAEKGGAVWAMQNDNRVTRIGKFLRKTRLDEIPQFINVLKGDMSFIGPRPERPEFVKKLNAAIPYYYRRFDIPPGITGLAQTRDAYAADIKQTRRKLKYDLLYVRKKCLLMDAKIFFNTIGTVVLGKGAR